jgi:SPASM domain peptide maturase of grasp-with-spasm system
MRLYSIPVNGYKQAIIIDLSRGIYKIIPLLLYEILVNSRTTSVQSIKISFNNQYNEGIDKYFSLLEKEDFGMFTNDPSRFPPLKKQWFSPLKITNFICDFDETSTHSASDILNQLEEIGCEAIQFRVFCNLRTDFIEEIMHIADNSCISFIEIIGGWSEDLDIEELKNILNETSRIRRIILHSSPDNDLINLGSGAFDQKIIKLKLSITTHEYCGIIQESTFAVNISSYMEGLFHNSCLNKKLSIDVHGNIKNCPSMEHTFGHVKNTKLKDIFSVAELTNYWNITKEKIDICKDCEFRFICTDCRAFIQSKENILSKPAKCNYNPYEAEWS